jgi:hypothetical protein
MCKSRTGVRLGKFQMARRGLLCFDLKKAAYIGCSQVSEACNTSTIYTNSVHNSRKTPVRRCRTQNKGRGCNYVLPGQGYHTS